MRHSSPDETITCADHQGIHNAAKVVLRAALADPDPPADSPLHAMATTTTTYC